MPTARDTVEGVSTPPVDAVLVYRRPGCVWCHSLERSLDRLGVPYRALDIWDDPEAAAFVRSVARGNETVPTVTIGDQTMVNPSGRQIASALRDEAPHLLPQGYEVPKPGLLERVLERLR